ncbi:MAG: type II toxin-antitoxin system VapC family toxin [Bacteroidota bacterium]|nr:type II toxin-antitoxin system VapC family toxin [Bacteroidota bacterium]
MINYLLDTDRCIFFINGKFGLKEKLQAEGKQRLFISEITIAELKFGAENSQKVEYNRKIVEKFVKASQVIPIAGSIGIYAKEKAGLRKQGTLIDDFDLLIGATAISNEMTLLTRNEKHFKRINNLTYENWIDNFSA